MSYSIAKKAIDSYFQLFNKARPFNKNRKPIISFYGGEPLINFKLIQKSTEYIKSFYRKEYDETHFTLTTNASLITDEIAHFFKENHFIPVISLDGSKKEHDKHRVDADRKGTFDLIYPKLMSIFEALETPIFVNTVYSIDTDLSAVINYFSENPQFICINISPVNSLHSSYYDQFDSATRERFNAQMNALRSEYLSYVKAGKRHFSNHKIERKVYLLDLLFSRSCLGVIIRSLFQQEKPGSKYTSTCIPGDRIFVDIGGDYYPCEKVERSISIGNIERGLELDLVAEYMNKFQSEVNCKCVRCPIKQSCPSCFATFLDKGEFVADKEICNDLNNKFKDSLELYCTINELNNGWLNAFRSDYYKKIKELVVTLKMKDYFRLFEECFLVNDVSGESCVYNLINGYVYNISKKETNILMLFENNMNIDEVSVKCNLTKEKINTILQKLVVNDIGSYYSQPVYIEKMFIDRTWAKLMLNRVGPMPSSVFIILESYCYQNCTFCGDKIFHKYSCSTCFKKNRDNKNNTTFEDYLFALNYLNNINTKKIIFTGGDILLNFNYNIKIIEYAASLSFEQIYIIIGVNRTIDQHILNKLKKLNVILILKIEINEASSISNNKLLKNNFGDVPFIISLVFDSKVTSLHSMIIEECQKYYPLAIESDIAFSKASMDDEIYKSLHEFRKTSIYDYSHVIEHSNCLYGILTITDEGTIASCPRLTNKPLGKILDIENCTSEEKVNKFWDLNKSRITKCSKCRYRYICDDCRYIEYSLTNDLYAMATCPIDSA